MEFGHYPDNLYDVFGPEPDPFAELRPDEAVPQGDAFLGLLDAQGASAIPSDSVTVISDVNEVESTDAVGETDDEDSGPDSDQGDATDDTLSGQGDATDDTLSGQGDATDDALSGQGDATDDAAPIEDIDQGDGEDADTSEPDLSGGTDIDIPEIPEDDAPVEVDAEGEGPDVNDTQGSGDASNEADAGGEISSDTDEDAIEDIAEPEAPKVPWLLSIDNGSDMLQKINTETGETTDVCQLNISSSYPSLTFSRDNKLFASRGGTALDIIDPCTCSVTAIGSYGGFSGVNGITSDQGIELFGVAVTQDDLIAISTSIGLATSVGDLGLNFGATGATWSDEDDTLYSIDASSDALYTIDPDTGVASYIAPVDMDFGTVGIELHPDNGVIYACSSAANLLSVDKFTGQVTVIGPMNQQEACTNLAAPYLPVACLEDL